MCSVIKKKSTTLGVLSVDIKLTAGEIFLNRFNLLIEPRYFLQTKILLFINKTLIIVQRCIEIFWMVFSIWCSDW